MKDALHHIVNKLLIANGIALDKEELALQIASHPSYPSLHAITGVLNHFGIANMAAEVPVNTETLAEMPKTFIAHYALAKDNSDFVLVTRHNKNTIILQKTTTKKEKISTTAFLENWKGILVAVDENEKTALKPSTYNLIPIVLLGLISSFALWQSHFLTLNYALYILTSIAGVVISYLILKHELGFQSKVVDAVCTGSEKTSCDAVLHSSGAKIAGLFKMSDASLVYFSTLALTSIVLVLMHNSFINTLIIASFAAIPVVAYSLYYQKVVVKKWCPLCLATAAVLCCQILLASFANPLRFSWNMVGFLVLLASINFVIASYTKLKKLLMSMQKNKSKLVASLKFKKQFTLFNALYKKEPELETSIANNLEIVLGNPKADLQLTLITSPMCGHCKPKHQELEQLLQQDELDLGATIRFNVSPKNKENPAYRIASTLLTMYQEDKKQCRMAMAEIYATGSDYKAWLKKYQYFELDQTDTIAAAYDWCVQNAINFTPAIYLNNKKYPQAYDLADLTLFAEELNEALSKNTETKVKPSILL